MNLMSTIVFANHCKCTRQAIGKYIMKGKIVPVTFQPVVIDADEYPDLIKLIRLRSDNRDKS